MHNSTSSWSGTKHSPPRTSVSNGQPAPSALSTASSTCLQSKKLTLRRSGLELANCTRQLDVSLSQESKPAQQHTKVLVSTAATCGGFASSLRAVTVQRRHELHVANCAVSSHHKLTDGSDLFAVRCESNHALAPNTSAVTQVHCAERRTSFG